MPRFDQRLRQLGIEQLWAMGLDGTGVRVGHVDTGVQGAHPALEGRVEASVFCTHRGSIESIWPPVDHDGHGTHTAGLICGGRIDGRTRGVAPAAKLYSAAALEDGPCLIRVLAGLRWLCEQNVEVVCLPIGLVQTNPVWWTALACLRRRDISLVCAAGNCGPGLVCAPASYGHVLSVGASEVAPRRELATWRVLPSSGRRAGGPGYAAAPHVLAPGESLRSAGLHLRSDICVRSTGSSQACALVTGIVALLRQACPRARSYQVESALLRSASEAHGSAARMPRTDVLSTGSVSGMINPAAALKILKTGRRHLPRSRRVQRRPPWFRDPRLLQRRTASDCILVDDPGRSRTARPLLNRISQCLRRARLPPPDFMVWPEAALVWARLNPAQWQCLWAEEAIPVLSAGDAGPNRMEAITGPRVGL